MNIIIEIETVRAVIREDDLDAIAGDDTSAYAIVVGQMLSRVRTGRFVKHGSGEPPITDPDFYGYITVYERRNNRWIKVETAE